VRSDTVRLPVFPGCSCHISSRCVCVCEEISNSHAGCRRVRIVQAPTPQGALKIKHTLVIPFCKVQCLTVVPFAFSERDAIHRGESHQRCSNGSASCQAGSRRNNKQRPIMSSLSFRHLLRIFTSSSLYTRTRNEMIEPCLATIFIVLHLLHSRRNKPFLFIRYTTLLCFSFHVESTFSNYAELLARSTRLPIESFKAGFINASLRSN